VWERRTMCVQWCSFTRPLLVARLRASAPSTQATHVELACKMTEHMLVFIRASTAYPWPYCLSGEWLDICAYELVSTMTTICSRFQSALVRCEPRSLVRLEAKHSQYAAEILGCPCAQARSAKNYSPGIRLGCNFVHESTSKGCGI
jgi:hypothetical protein